MPRISAIIPNYNHGALLHRAIAALQVQQPQPAEIIVIDDASTDNSLAVIESLASHYPSLRILRNESNVGTVGSLNRGIMEARCEYIYMGAADDMALPGLFATGLKLLDSYPEAAFACGECRIVNEVGVNLGIRPPIRPVAKPAFIPPSEVPQLLRYSENWAHTSTAILRRDRVLAARSLDVRLGSFADGFLLRQLALRHGFCFAPRLLAQWLERPDGYSRTAAKSTHISLQLMAAARQKFESDPAFPHWYADLFERRYRFGIARVALLSYPPGREIVRLATETALDRAAIATALALPYSLGRFLALTWLTLRKRPYSLARLMHTRLVRLLESRSSSAP
jgi:glycosyltransferase involved in cell wall biosynthesis